MIGCRPSRGSRALAFLGMLGLLVGQMALAEQPSGAAATAAIGKPAPEFTLKDIDGKEHKLSTYKGKIVVLEWASHMCPVCKGVYDKKVPQNTFAQFKDKGVVWLTIDSSNFAEEKKEDIKKWWTAQGSPFPYLLDAPGTVGKSFGAKTTPHCFVIDKQGNLAYQGAIDDGNVNKEKPTNFVAAAVDALLKGSTVAKAETQPYGCSVKYKS